MSKRQWEQVTLGDVTAESRKRAGGDANLRARPVYGVDRSVGLTPVAKYTSSNFERYKLLEHGMFAYNPMRLNIGSIGYCSPDIAPGLVSPDYVVFGCDTKRIEPNFLKYYIDSPAWKEWTANAGVGSVRMRIYFKELERLPLLLPPIREQHAIVEILKALDEKIELNQRMNYTLESMARAVFCQWFVDGERVENWETGTISSLAQITSGKRPESRKDTADAEYRYPLYGGGGIMAYTNHFLYDFPILLTGRVGTLGIIFRIAEPCWASDNTLVIVSSKPEYFFYLYFHLSKTDLQVLNRGSTQPLLTQSDLQKIEILLPTRDLLVDFTNLVSPLFARIDANEKESRTVLSLRDTLLPKLMRGEVRVKVPELCLK